MKLTRILPRKLAVEWQRYDLTRTDGKLEYHKGMAKYLQERSDEGHTELNRLEDGE